MSAAILRRFDNFADVRSWRRNADRLAAGAVATGWHDVDGVFVGSDANWIAVVRDDELLVARPGNQRPVSEIDLVEVAPTDEAGREVRLRFQDASVWIAEYKALGPPPGETDPTPFVEPGDFDFGDYVRSLVLDGERRDRLFRRAR